MLSITFQGLCGIAQTADGSVVLLPICGASEHVAVLVAPASVVLKPKEMRARRNSGFWEPDGIGVDTGGQTICFWFLHRPAANAARAKGRRLMLSSCDGTASVQRPFQFVSGKIVPLASAFQCQPVHSTDAKLGRGTRIRLPMGYVTGTGKDAQFSLIDAAANIVAPGPFSERMVWTPLCESAGTTWKLSDGNVAVYFQTMTASGISLSITNARPIIADTGMAHHFDGIYEAVREKKNNDPVPDGMKFSLLDRMVMKDPTEGVDCVPPAETPLADDSGIVTVRHRTIRTVDARLAREGVSRLRSALAPPTRPLKKGGRKK